jgi:hypothetical protein
MRRTHHVFAIGELGALKTMMGFAGLNPPYKLGAAAFRYQMKSTSYLARPDNLLLSTCRPGRMS